jgi:hypothetical protein
LGYTHRVHCHPWGDDLKQLSEQQLRGLLGFIGYGNLAAPLRFIGAEEGFGGAMSPVEQHENLVARCGWRSVEDLRDAHLALTEGGRPIDVARPRSGSTGVWRFMARFALAVEGDPAFAEAERAANYMRTRLGRRGGTTLLTELRPIPARRSAQPPALRNFGDEGLIESLLQDRRRLQTHVLREYAGVTLCYGIAKREDFAAHLEIEWEPMCGPFARGADGMSFLLPFFGNGQMSEGLVKQFVASPEFQAALSRLPRALTS